MPCLKFGLFVMYVCFSEIILTSGDTRTMETPHLSSENLFDIYKKKFQKSYQKGSAEYETRYQNFMASVKRIEERNKNVFILQERNVSTQYGLNKFSDLSPTEFKEKYLALIPHAKLSHQLPEDILDMASISFSNKFDWRDKHVVTAVKNQGACGACWAFSIIENVESAWAIEGNTLVGLSMQEIVDCSPNQGCTGGFPCHTLAWLKKKHIKIVKDSDYPYHASAGKCQNETGTTFGVYVASYFCRQCSGACPTEEKDKMIPLVFNSGPLAVDVDATSWQDYMGGIIQHHCSYGEANHSVQIVGYDLTGKIPYWIVRNSWGRDFGDGGYLYIKIGENLCGVANSYSGVTSVTDS